MHAYMHTYIYTCDFCNAQLCLRDQLHAYMSMHAARTRITITYY